MSALSTLITRHGFCIRNCAEIVDSEEATIKGTKGAGGFGAAMSLP